MSDLDDLDEVSITAFGRRFHHLLPDIASELKTLEDEGAIYSYFADYDLDGNFLGTFTRYRIQFKPAEIFEFVESTFAMQPFLKVLDATGDFEKAVAAIVDPKYRKRVQLHTERTIANGDAYRILGCHASFLSGHLESLVCGNQRHRYEVVDKPDTDELVLRALNSVSVSCRHLRDRRHGRPPFVVENEYDVQDLTEAALRAVFSDVRREDSTPTRVDGHNRVDFVIPSINALVECKYVRNKGDVRTVRDQLRVDIESYSTHPNCRKLFAYVYDPDKRIADPERFCNELYGLRIIRRIQFLVIPLVGS
ncbi:MAG: hypothetical protein ACRDTH_29265 [Pseudonocardiaceae bacterium]